MQVPADCRPLDLGGIVAIIRYTIYDWEPPQLSKEDASALVREIRGVGQDNFTKALKRRLSVPAELGGPKPFTLNDVLEDAKRPAPASNPVGAIFGMAILSAAVLWMAISVPPLLVPLFIIGGVSLGSFYWMRSRIDRWVQSLVDAHGHRRSASHEPPSRGMRTASRPTAVGGDPFEIAGAEVLSGNVRPGLWARALVEGRDNENASRAAYVRARVEELQLGESRVAVDVEATTDERPSTCVTSDIEGSITFDPNTGLYCVQGEDGVTRYGYDRIEDAEASARRIAASMTEVDSLAGALRRRTFRVAKVGALWKVREPNGAKFVFITDVDFIEYAQPRVERENTKDAAYNVADRAN